MPSYILTIQNQEKQISIGAIVHCQRLNRLMPANEMIIQIPDQFPTEHIDWVIEFCEHHHLQTSERLQDVQLFIPKWYQEYITRICEHVTSTIGELLCSFLTTIDWFDIPLLSDLVLHKIAALYINKNYSELKTLGLVFHPVDEQHQTSIDTFEAMHTYYTYDIVVPKTKLHRNIYVDIITPEMFLS